MKLKIISDGTWQGTKVVNAETGEMVEGVQHVTWDCVAGTLPIARIEICPIPVEVEGEKV